MIWIWISLVLMMLNMFSGCYLPPGCFLWWSVYFRVFSSFRVFFYIVNTSYLSDTCFETFFNQSCGCYLHFHNTSFFLKSRSFTFFKWIFLLEYSWFTVFSFCCTAKWALNFTSPFHVFFFMMYGCIIIHTCMDGW